MSNASVDEKLKALEDEEKREEQLRIRAEEVLKKAANQIVLDIGGTKFTTSTITLLSHKGSIFENILQKGAWKPNAKGRYFIDRDPSQFLVLLNFLRTGKIKFKDMTEEFQEELKYYMIELPKVPSPSTLITTDQFQYIVRWLGASNLSLLFKASKDGFTCAKFHEKCDNKGPTLVIIESSQGYLFGGYASIPWFATDSKRSAPGSFLFSLLNQSNTPPRQFPMKDSMIGGFNGWGPMFGSDYDLYIKNNCNTSPNDTRTRTTDITAATFVPDGFLVKDYEVFLVAPK